MLCVVLGASASAQVCKESNGNVAGKANMDCDMRYRDQLVTCDKKNPSSTKEVLGTRPACPAKPMPMLDTPKASYIADYNPFLFQYPRDPGDSSKPYAGAFALGTPGDASRTFQLFGNTAPGTKRLSSCTTQIKLPTDPKNDSEWAMLTRLQADNCANQYILNSAIWPFQKESTKILSLDDPKNPGKKIDLDGECQPLKPASGEKNEYDATVYLKAAWTKLLIDPEYRKTTKALKGVPCVKDFGLAKKSGLTSGGLPCDREPHLPKGTTLENPLQMPKDFPEEIRLSSIATVPYEEINDPTHPFSPRWDFLLNDRDYSNLSLNLLGSPGVAVAIQAGLHVYMSKVKNSVFCAGVRNADKESDKDKKEDAEVKVDVLEFRRPAFEGALQKRVGYNAVCKLHKAVFNKPDAPLFVVAPASFCFLITRVSPFPPFIYGKDKDCWDCYGLSGKVDDETQHPPCTTQYLGTDNHIKGAFPGGLNAFKRSANCGTKFDKICKDLRAPYTPLNKLKMRYHNPDDKDDKDGNNVVLKDGALEGMTHSEYFGNHMPYPKIWDLGQSLQAVPTNDKTSQPPLDTTGQYTAIVGVGREAAAKVAADAAPADADGKKADEKFYDQRCKAQGWGDTINPLGASFGGVTVSVPDPITSWTEMKLYQARTQRSIGLSCIGRYEKVFKPGSAENMMLLIAGGEWERAVISKCPRLKDGRTGECEYMTIKQYADAGSPEGDDSTVYLKQLQNQGWPLAWRGYMSAEKAETKFPAFGGSDSSISGLDKAEPGDIIMMPNGPNDKDGLAKLAFVISTNFDADGKQSRCSKENNCYVQVLEPDNGKWPDVCGTTDTWGEMKSRYYFKPGHFPDEAKTALKDATSTTDCEETKISHCEMSAWDKLKIYRAREDVRQGCKNKDKSIECEKDE